MNLITFDRSLLGRREAGPLARIEPSQEVLQNILNGFAFMGTNFFFPVVGCSESQIVAVDSLCLDGKVEDGRDVFFDSIHFLRTLSDKVLKNGNGIHRASESIPLERENLLRCSPHQQSWFVDLDAPKNPQKRSFDFYHSDGRMISILGNGQDPFLVGLGVIESVMCYILVDKSPLLGKEVALFVKKPLTPNCFRTARVADISETIADHYAPYIKKHDIKTFDRNNKILRPGDTIPSLYRVLTDQSVGFGTFFTPWIEDPNSQRIPLAGAVVDENSAALVAGFYQMPDAGSFFDQPFFYGAQEALQSAFFPR